MVSCPSGCFPLRRDAVVLGFFMAGLLISCALERVDNLGA
jgi:hypothetical protein